METNDFDALAERILHSLLTSPTVERTSLGSLAQAAVATADALLDACRARHETVYANSGFTANELNILKSGNVILCIKSVRARTGWNLKQAKTHVDRMRNELRDQEN